MILNFSVVFVCIYTRIEYDNYRLRKMRFRAFVLVFAGCIAFSLIAKASAKGECSLTMGRLKLQEGEAIEISKACLRFECLGENKFYGTESQECFLRFRNAPNDYIRETLISMAAKIKKGEACQAY